MGFYTLYMLIRAHTVFSILLQRLALTSVDYFPPTLRHNYDMILTFCVRQALFVHLGVISLVLVRWHYLLPLYQRWAFSNRHFLSSTGRAVIALLMKKV